MTAKAVSPGARLVHAFIVFVSGWPNKTHPIWYSSRTIAKELGIGQRTVERHVSELKKIGLISRWFDPSGRTMTVPKKITVETLRNLDPSRVSGKFSEWAEMAGGVRQIGGGGPSNWRVDTDGSLQTEDTSASHPAGAKAEEDTAVEKKKRGTIGDSLERTQAKTRKADEKQMRRRATAQRNLSSQGVEKWKGTKFFKFFAERCAIHGVKISDDIENAVKYVPPRFAKAMNDVIGRLETRGLGKRDLAAILDRLVSGWNGDNGFANYFIVRKMWRTQEISIYLIRKRIDDVIRVTGFAQAEASDGPSLRVPKGSVDDLVK
jgi:hypothetical protein